MSTSHHDDSADPPNRAAPPSRVDDLDRRILQQLAVDGRQSARSLARHLGVAAGTIGDRIGRMERAGIIKGYSAIIDLAALGRPIAFVVGLQINQGQALDEALDELMAFPEVESVHVVTGPSDLLVFGRVTDPVQLNDFLIKRMWQSAMFRHSETMLIIDQRISLPNIPDD